MRETIIETEAMGRFDSAVDEVMDAERGFSGFVLAYGQAGRGKSVAADRYHCTRGGAYVRVWQGWSQTAFLQRLMFEVRGTNEDMPRHTGNRCKEFIVKLLEKKRQPLFIDEADRLQIAHEVEFGPISPAEAALYAMQAAGLEVPLALAKEIAQKTEGDFRLVRNAMILLEKSAKATGSFTVDQKMLDAALSAHSWRRK